MTPLRAPVVAIFPEFEIKSLREIEDLRSETFLFIKELRFELVVKISLEPTRLKKNFQASNLTSERIETVSEKIMIGRKKSNH